MAKKKPPNRRLRKTLSEYLFQLQSGVMHNENKLSEYRMNFKPGSVIAFFLFLLFPQINGIDVHDVTHAEALDLVRKTKGGKLTLVVQKRAVKVHRTVYHNISWYPKSCFSPLTELNEVCKQQRY